MAISERGRTGADAVVAALVSSGVDTIFGLPGDTGVALYDALYRARDRIAHVMARDERHAATMADVYARVTNRVGVVEVSSGGGATFSVGGLGEPFAASVPLLVIASDIDDRSRGSGALTELDLGLLYAGVTKKQVALRSPGEIFEAVRAALVEARSGRPGPVAVTIPENLLDEPASWPVTATEEPVVPRPLPSRSAIEAAAAALRAARRPCVIAGSGVHLSGAASVLTAFARQFRIPVGTTIQGKGVFPESDDLSLGVTGANGSRGYSGEYIAQADVVLIIGSRANATDTNSYTAPNRAGATVIQIDIDPARAGRNFPAALPLVGDAGAVLDRLRAELSSWVSPAADDATAWIAERRAAWTLAQEERTGPAGPPLHPAAVLTTARSALPEDTVVVADCGTPTPYVSAHWDVESGSRQVVMARGHGPMGYAIPGAVGAAMALPGRPVLCVTTDGSFGMAVGELETVARLRLPITFVQLTNGSYGWIKMLQHLYHGGRYFGVDLARVDSVAVAAAFGIGGRHVESIAELADVLAGRDGASAPLYLDVHVREAMAELPPVAPWERAVHADGPVERPVY